MKNLRIWLWSLLLLLPFGCQCQNEASLRPSGDAIVRWHFAGRAALAQATNALRLKVVDALPTTASLRSQVASNLSSAPARFWQRELPAGVPDGAALLRPLFEDLLNAESYGEVKGPADRAATILAIELSDARARVWETNLWQLVALWKQEKPAALARDGAAGWEVRRPSSPNRFQVLRSGKWTVLFLGDDKAPAASAWLQQLKGAGRPFATSGGEILEVETDSPQLGKWLPLFADLGLPPLKMTMTGRGENVRTEVRLRYAAPLALKYETWHIPTNMIGEPLSSFTVARGIGPLVQRLIDFKSLEIGPAPEQICLWGVTNDPCRLYFTFPIPDAIEAVKKIALTGPRFIEKSLGPYLGDFFYASNRNTVLWGSLPYIQPYLQGATNAGIQFVHGGIFPLFARQMLAPPELFKQIGTRTNLVYYDWEMTPYRILHANQIYQILDIVSRRSLQSPNSASKLWLVDMVRELATDAMNPSQTVTEILQTGPNELSLTRKSHLGLTGFEMATLSAWIDSPGFPFRYEPPRRMRIPLGTNGPAIGTNKARPSPLR